MTPDRAAVDVQELMTSLGDLPEPHARPVLVIVSGLPGTGKSYLSRRLAERLPCAIVESDAMRRRLFACPTYSGRESQRLFSACHALIDQLLGRGIGLIFDATNLVEQHRERLYRIADQRDARLIIVEVDAPAGVVRERLERRAGGAPGAGNSEADWSVYEGMRRRRQRIRRQYFAVDTSGDIKEAIDRIVREAGGGGL